MEDRETMEHSYKSPVRKLVAFFEKSRDGWKAKHRELKKQLKKEQNQVRAVERSRAAWRRKAEDAARRVEELESELAEVQKNSRCRRMNSSRPLTDGRPDITTASA
jgi:septal ring factor EnvC (AmiA/AmiB activator)